jgi:uncharacterized protein YceK
MKKLLVILAIITLSGCASFKTAYQTARSEPYFLSGVTPDDISNYQSGSYLIITHTYNCYNGEYIVITWTRENLGYEIISRSYVYIWSHTVYRSTGICKK